CALPICTLSDPVDEAFTLITLSESPVELHADIVGNAEAVVWTLYGPDGTPQGDFSNGEIQLNAPLPQRKWIIAAGVDLNGDGTLQAGEETHEVFLRSFEITLSAGRSYIPAKSDWTGLGSAVSSTGITITAPGVPMAAIAPCLALEIAYGQGSQEYDPGQGTLTPGEDGKWIYEAREEANTQRFPKQKTVFIIPKYFGED